jgi:hypothetical protein
MSAGFHDLKKKKKSCLIEMFQERKGYKLSMLELGSARSFHRNLRTQRINKSYQTNKEVLFEMDEKPL